MTDYAAGSVSLLSRWWHALRHPKVAFLVGLGLVLFVGVVAVLLRPEAGVVTLSEEHKEVAYQGVSLQWEGGPLPKAVAVRMGRERAPTPPAGLRAISLLFRFEAPPEIAGQFTVGLPLEDAQAQGPFDFYTVAGERWEWVAAAAPGDAGVVQGTVPFLPQTLVAVAVSPSAPTVTAWLEAGAQEVPQAQSVVDVINPVLYILGQERDLQRQNVALPPGTRASLVPTVRLAFAAADAASRLLSATADREQLVKLLRDLATQGGHQGLDLDHRDASLPLREALTAFVGILAQELHALNRSLSITLPLPRKTKEGWDTGGYAWRQLGALADQVKVVPDQDQERNFQELSEALRYVTTLVERRKVLLVVRTLSRHQTPGGLEELTLQEALHLAAQVEVKDNATLAPGKVVTLIAPHLLPDIGATGLHWSDEAKAIRFSFPAAGGEHTVWVANPFSLMARLRLAESLHLGGVAVQSLGADSAEGPLWEVLLAYKKQGQLQEIRPNPAALSVRWETEAGELLAEGQSWANWPIPTTPGQYRAYAFVSDGFSRLGNALPYEVIPTPTPTPTPTPRPRPTPTPTATPVPGVVPPTPTPAPIVVPTPGGVKYPGVGYGMQVDPSNDLPRALGLVRGAGFGWVKVQLRWESLEGSKGNINWGEIDRIVNTVNGAGVRLLFSVVTAPAWSRPRDTDFGVPGPPANPQDFADFVGAIAARHKGRVHAYEVWNEQNVFYEWGGMGRLNAVQYVELLKRAYPAIKAADPDAVVLSGAPTPTGVNDGNIAYDDVVYLRMMYQAGLKDYSDAIAAHPSGYNNAPDDGPGTKTCCGTEYKGHWSFYYRRFEQFRQLMAEFGDTNKQIWFTEFGWASASGPIYSDYLYARDISEQHQADFLVRAFQIAKENGYIGVMLIWNLNYAPIAEPDDRWAKRAFSIIRPDWSPRPAYSALRDMPK